jgi:hypothetical protein
LQTGNNKQQPTNRNATTTLRLTGEWGMTEAQPLACKLQQQVQLRMQDPNLAKLKQTRASNKQQTNEQVPRGPTAAAGPQLCKVESNNNKQHPANQRASINQSTRNVGEEQYCPNSLQTRLYQKIRGKCIVTRLLSKHFRL